MNTLLTPEAVKQMDAAGRINLATYNVDLEVRRLAGERDPRPYVDYAFVWSHWGTVPRVRQFAFDPTWLDWLRKVGRLDEQEGRLQGLNRHATAEQIAYIWARGRARCHYCHHPVLPGRKMHADHFHPWSKGGLTLVRNLVAACPGCNEEKSDMPGEEYLAVWEARREHARREMDRWMQVHLVSVDG